MNDMSSVIVPKSDQISADDLIAGPRTITVTKVTIRSGQDQPVSINYDGDGGKPWKPCKSMSKVLVHIWGPDSSKYVGHSVTLYRDPKVKWGGMEVGGIRISHMSNISGDKAIPLTVTKGRKEVTVIKPIGVEKPAAPKTTEDKAALGATAMATKIIALKDRKSLEAFTSDEKVVGQRKWLADNRPELAAKIDDAVRAVLESFESDVPFDDIPMSEAAE